MKRLDAITIDGVCSMYGPSSVKLLWTHDVDHVFMRRDEFVSVSSIKVEQVFVFHKEKEAYDFAGKFDEVFYGSKWVEEDWKP